MANINIENISDVDINGDKLFEDSESFITELDDDVNLQEAIVGGLALACSCCCCCPVGSGYVN